jgi:serine/threonine protein phosphatase PrpC
MFVVLTNCLFHPVAPSSPLALRTFQVKKTLLSAAVGTEAAKVKYEARDKSGTTLVWAVVSDTQVVVANVGDSRAVLSQNNAQNVIVLSRDHNANFVVGDTDGSSNTSMQVIRAPLFSVGQNDNDPTGISVSDDWSELASGDVARVTKAGGCVNDDGYVLPVKSVTGEKLAMTRSLGNYMGKQSSELPAASQAICAAPEIAVHRRDGANADDFLVLACDGVWDVMSNAEVVKFVSEKLLVCPPGQADLDQVCHDLCVQCLEKGSQDNITAMLVDLRGNKTSTGTAAMKLTNANMATEPETRRSILTDLDNVAASASHGESDAPAVSQTKPIALNKLVDAGSSGPMTTPPAVGRDERNTEGGLETVATDAMPMTPPAAGVEIKGDGATPTRGIFI